MIAAGDDWRVALPGWQYEFPRDHFSHAEFKTEWWYFTGNLRAENGRRFGYQVTFFRHGIRSPAARGKERSSFIVNDLKFAHFAITEIDGGRFQFAHKINRGAFGEAGFGAVARAGNSTRVAWIESWELTLDETGNFRVVAGDERSRIALHYPQTKPWAIHGANGVSQKADGEGHASHYYSGTRLRTTGSLRLNGRESAVEGETWFDHEWATNQLTENQVGWNWFSIQLEDQTELMLYQMRTRDGGLDPNSSGTFISAQGATQHLRRDDYTLTPSKFWASKKTGGRYPIAWELTVPALELRLAITTRVVDQELVLDPISYWEGAIDLDGVRGAQRVRGHGYMELTGYAGGLVGLSASSK